MKVFHHDDMDGKCAAHLVVFLCPMWCDGATFSGDLVPINYGMEFPFDSIKPDETVFILDYSIEPEEMKRLLEITEHVTWIDHHKSAIRKFRDFRWVDYGLAERTASHEDLPGYRISGVSGCELTYRWIHRFGRDREPPSYVALIGDRDTWTFKYGSKTRQFFAGLEAYDTDPMSRVWASLHNDTTGDYHDTIISEGFIIQRYRERTEREYIERNGFYVEFEGHNCYAVNGRYSSEPFEAVVPNTEIWMPFRFMPEGYWMVSLYSDKVDVSVIAERYEYHGKRGGGHKGAAGFECDYPPFLPRPEVTP
jgi:oligoribonuclease NrnB/cAMP/cGMP phosphodiesterase (DHH superfamily)